MTRRLLAVLCVLIGASTVHATTFYVDSTAGSDATAGTSRGAGAWSTWGKFTDALNRGTIKAGDTVLFRPGRYYASQGASRWFINGPGGTAASPITISVDTNYQGDVEVNGSLKAGLPGATAWAQAKSCKAGTALNIPCDSDANCPSGGAGSCQAVANVFYTTVSNTNDTDGNGPGTAFQPGANPGDPPKFFEILYSPPATPIQMPTFTAGHDQAWAYSEKVAVCRAAGSPWQCCTGSGTGSTCTKSQRLYVRTVAGANPGSASPPVEFPYGMIIDSNSATTPTAYLTFTNHGNGRIFHFWWSMKVLAAFRNTHHWVIEDFDLGYSSLIYPSMLTSRPAWIDSGSGWPRNNGGSSYLVHYAPLSNGGIHHMTWRRGKVHGSSGDEAFHIGRRDVMTGSCSTLSSCTATGNGIPVACNSGTCAYANVYGDTFDTVEFYDAPWSVLNGHAPNTASVAQSWPPSNYPAAWANTYKTHWSPLGGGGQSGGAWIILSAGNRFRNLYVHDTGEARFECDPGDPCTVFDEVIENSRFDWGLLKYAADSSGQPYPALPVLSCDKGPSANCGGYGGRRGIDIVASFSYTGVPGVIFRNNIITNGYGQAFTTNCCAMPTLNAPLGSQIVNNTFQFVGDGVYAPSTSQLYVAANWGSPTSKGIFKNNIITQSGTVTAGVTAMFDPTGIANVDIDYNNWGPGVSWKWGNSANTSAFTTFAANSAATASTNEKHSFQANPLFVGGGDFTLQTTSPARDRGIDLTGKGVTTDLTGLPRPQGPAFDIGAYETGSGLAPPRLLSVEPVTP